LKFSVTTKEYTAFKNLSSSKNLCRHISYVPITQQKWWHRSNKFI